MEAILLSRYPYGAWNYSITKNTIAIYREIFMTQKITLIIALGSLAVLSACNRKVRTESRTISASSDASGSHVGIADVPGPVTVTCVSATDDTGSATPP